MVHLERNRLLWRARVVRLEFNDLALEVTWKIKPFLGMDSYQLVLTCLLLSYRSWLVVKIETKLLSAVPMSLKVGNWKLKQWFQFSFCHAVTLAKCQAGMAFAYPLLLQLRR